MKPQPNSPLALSQASLWRHMKRFFVNLNDGILEHLKETCIHIYSLLVYVLVWALCPITFPLFAYFTRRGYQKKVAKWNQQ